MKKNQIGRVIISSAIIWAALIVIVAFKLKGTDFKEPVVLIIAGAMALNLVGVLLPLAVKCNREK